MEEDTKPAAKKKDPKYHVFKEEVVAIALPEDRESGEIATEQATVARRLTKKGKPVKATSKKQAVAAALALSENEGVEQDGTFLVIADEALWEKKRGTETVVAESWA